MSMFDPAQFLEQTYTESNDTKTLPVPAGEYQAVIEKVDIRQWTSKKDPTVSGLALDVQWSIDDAGVRALLGRDKVTVKQGVMLELREDGQLDFGKGKNASLGRLREAVNLNAPGRPFAFSQLNGQFAKVKVEHRIEGDNIYAEVKQVARVA